MTGSSWPPTSGDVPRHALRIGEAHGRGTAVQWNWLREKARDAERGREFTRSEL